MKCFLGLLVGCLLLTGCDSSNDQRTDRDNTAVNARDANDATVTPIDQSNESKDIDEVAAIRKAVLDIDDLSTNGKNVKIITGEGRVVLRGPVDSQSEKEAIEQVAKRIAGNATVVNELEVETD